MGTDIHTYFERKVNGKWELLWQPNPADDYWWEVLIDKELEDKLKCSMINDKVSLADIERDDYTGNEDDMLDDEDLMYDKFEFYYNNYMSHEEIMDMFYSGKYVCFNHNYLPTFEYENIVDLPEQNYYKKYLIDFRINTRNYEWFSLVGGVRGGDVNVEDFDTNLGLPEDTSRFIKQLYLQEYSDAHSANWLMIDRILECEIVKNNYENHYKWFADFIEDPENTRMVFWFDN